MTLFNNHYYKINPYLDKFTTYIMAIIFITVGGLVIRGLYYWILRITSSKMYMTTAAIRRDWYDL